MKNLFYEMLRIRMIELSIVENYNNWKMRCPVHLSIGQESAAVGICANLKKNDEIVTAHRSHAHYLAKGGSLKKMIAELHGKETGCAEGLGGSMHLIDLNENITAAVPIVGSTIPIGVGKAWANKLNSASNIVVIFFGDGATEEGVFFESLDFAVLKNLKILFVCENNKYSVYSSLEKRQSKKRNLIKIAKAMGLNTQLFKDHDVLNIYKNTKKIIQTIKKKSVPYLIQINTWRYLEHCGPNYDDNLGYREKRDKKYWAKKDQIFKYENLLKKKGLITTKDIIDMKNKLRNEINRAFKFAEKSNFPSKKILKKYIYSK
tara:strand:+ start:1187 stop:2140 length:954 start_codon:yes stop_codon:yes gene_type:complete